MLCFFIHFGTFSSRLFRRQCSSNSGELNLGACQMSMSMAVVIEHASIPDTMQPLVHKL